MTPKDSANPLRDILDESIQLELAAAEIYFTFYHFFPEDADFWWQLVEEEKNHAALLRSGKEYFQPIDKFPDSMLHVDIGELQAVNKQLSSLLETFASAPPDRTGAFSTALMIEQSAGELHYQKFMNIDIPGTPLEDIFRKLNREDRNHVDRLHGYMSENGISLPS